ncbi:MAG: hypothetical protein ABSG32_12250 [Terriglobia bacterium]|jgi:C4-dicarboxylate-specific signal transduction histidine kinase
MAMKMIGARSFAQFILSEQSEVLLHAPDDSFGRVIRSLFWRRHKAFPIVPVSHAPQLPRGPSRLRQVLINLRRQALATLSSQSH